MEEEVHGEKVESDEMEETELGSLECEECEESEHHKAIISTRGTFIIHVKKKIYP